MWFSLSMPHTLEIIRAQDSEYLYEQTSLPSLSLSLYLSQSIYLSFIFIYLTPHSLSLPIYLYIFLFIYLSLSLYLSLNARFLKIFKNLAPQLCHKKITYFVLILHMVLPFLLYVWLIHLVIFQLISRMILKFFDAHRSSYNIKGKV